MTTDIGKSKIIMAATALRGDDDINPDLPTNVTDVSQLSALPVECLAAAATGGDGDGGSDGGGGGVAHHIGHDV